EDPLGEALVARDLRPAVTAVGGLEDPAARPTRDQLPGAPHRLPEPRVEDSWVDRIERQVDRPGAVVPIQHLVPSLAAVLGAEHAAGRIRAERVAQDGDVCE